jgi:hypothetical protein
MKKGKSVSVKGYKKFKANYGTVDSKNLKSLYKYTIMVNTKER